MSKEEFSKYFNENFRPKLEELEKTTFLCLDKNLGL